MEHEKLICYRQLLKITEEIVPATRRWPRGYGYLVDQIQRALSSAVLNLAEGNGKRGYSKERKRFFLIAMGSLSEIAACLDLAKIFKLFSDSKIDPLKEKIRKVYFQIRKLP